METRKAPIGKEPEIAVAVGEGRPYVSGDQAVAAGVVPNAIGGGIDAVDTADRAGVDAAGTILRQTPHLIAGETVRALVDAHRHVARGRVIDASQTALGAGDPKAAGAVAMQRLNCAAGNALRLLEAATLKS